MDLSPPPPPAVVYFFKFVPSFSIEFAHFGHFWLFCCEFTHVLVLLLQIVRWLPKIDKYQVGSCETQRNFQALVFHLFCIDDDVSEGNWIPMQNSILNLNFKHDPVLTSLKKPCTWGEAGCKWGGGNSKSLYITAFDHITFSFWKHLPTHHVLLNLSPWYSKCFGSAIYWNEGVPNDTNSLFSEIMHPLQINHNGQHRRLLLEDWWSQNKKLLKIKRYWFILLKLTKSTTASGELGSTGGRSMGGVGGWRPSIHLPYFVFALT